MAPCVLCLCPFILETHMLPPLFAGCSLSFESYFSFFVDISLLLTLYCVVLFWKWVARILQQVHRFCSGNTDYPCCNTELLCDDVEFVSSWGCVCVHTWESGIEQRAPHPGEKLEQKPTEKGKGFSALQGLKNTCADFSLFFHSSHLRSHIKVKLLPGVYRMCIMLRS